MRKAKFTVIAGAIGALAAVSLSGPVEAGTCQPVDVKGQREGHRDGNDAGAS